MVREFTSVPAPYCYRCAYDCSDSCANCGQEYALEVEAAIAASGGNIAAVILEPVNGATLGAVVPPPGYLEKVAEICRRNEVLLIADEVMTGMGRTGRNFAVDHWGITPDILVTAKGLSSGYAPLGAIIISHNVVDAIATGTGSLHSRLHLQLASHFARCRKCCTRAHQADKPGPSRGLGPGTAAPRTS